MNGVNLINVSNKSSVSSAKTSQKNTEISGFGEMLKEKINSAKLTTDGVITDTDSKNEAVKDILMQLISDEKISDENMEDILSVLASLFTQIIDTNEETLITISQDGLIKANEITQSSVIPDKISEAISSAIEKMALNQAEPVTKSEFVQIIADAMDASSANTKAIDRPISFENNSFKTSDIPEQLKVQNELHIEKISYSEDERLEAAKEIISNSSQTQFRVTKENSNEDSELQELTAMVKTTQTQTSQDVKASEIQTENKAEPVENQLLNAISKSAETVENGKIKELTLTLNPEELGKVQIKLIKSATELTVEITAQNSETQKLIQGRIPELMASLSQTENNVKDVFVVEPNENAQELMSQTESQNSEQNHFYQQSQNNNRYFTDKEVTTEELSQISEYHEGAKLWQTA